MGNGETTHDDQFLYNEDERNMKSITELNPEKATPKKAEAQTWRKESKCSHLSPEVHQRYANCTERISVRCANCIDMVKLNDVYYVKLTQLYLI